MPSHSEQQFSPYSTRQLFDMVADIERYPEFLPWCRAARILERGEGECLAELLISFSQLRERYTSRVVLHPPLEPHGPCDIQVTMVKGPFEYLNNAWRFTPCAEGTQIDFTLEFKFRSALLEKLIGSVFGRATAKMAGAFKARAHALYGES